MELAKSDLKKQNDYEYNKMIEDFQLKDSIVKERKKRFKNLVDLNKRYPTQVNSMRETVRYTEEMRMKKMKKELDDKQQRYEEQREQIRSQNEEANLKNKKLRENREENIRKNFNKAKEKQEEKRLEEAKRTQNKLKEYTENSEDKRLERQKQYVAKLRQSQEFHEKNLKIRDEKYEQQIKERDEKAFEKYTKNYWLKKERAQKKKEDKKKELKHLEAIKELQEQNEEERMKKQKAYIKKLNDMTTKRLRLEEKRQIEYENIINEQKQKFAKTKINLENYKKTDELIRQNILEYQRALVFRGLDKDQATSLKRSNARENIILSQMEMGRKLNQFNREMNKLKDESILKKSFDQRRQIYKDLLKAEAEKKKKEEEEKLLNK